MPRSAVVICNQGAGHVQLLLPVIRGLARRGVTVHALTHADYRARVEAASARFRDLYAGRPLSAVDNRSIPIPVRFVTFAGVHAEALSREVAALDPGLIVYDTFSVVAPVIARALDLPCVNVFPNHAPVPERAVAALRADPRALISDECDAAVERLRTAHGLSGAHAFSYMELISPDLNLYPEPEPFLDPADRAQLEPLAFFGALPDPPPPAAGGVFNGDRPRLYCAFGTVVWFYYPGEARRALQTVCDAGADLDLEVVISLGGRALKVPARPAPRSDNVRVLNWVDQWGALAEAGAFLTHHGINSTHEAVYHRVPMLSCPFFGDQPALAARCQSLGLALPLTSGCREPLEPGRLRAALEALEADRAGFAQRLERARGWERRTVAGRDAIMNRMLDLMS